MASYDMKVTPEQQLVISKIRRGTVLTRNDYDVILEDIINKFEPKDAIITDEIDRYLRSRYFSGYNKNKIEKFLGEMIKC